MNCYCFALLSSLLSDMDLERARTQPSITSPHDSPTHTRTQRNKRISCAYRCIWTACFWSSVLLPIAQRESALVPLTYY
ncbi:hypothetical protein C8J56DRAFT_971472 [Mycena floridula]|nr:hypothetical protein C8J56DRAFT_971472 [Mycena floridula]